MRIFVTKKIQKLNWQGKNEGLKMRIVPYYKLTGKLRQEMILYMFMFPRADRGKGNWVKSHAPESVSL